MKKIKVKNYRRVFQGDRTQERLVHFDYLFRVARGREAGSEVESMPEA